MRVLYCVCAFFAAAVLVLAQQPQQRPAQDASGQLDAVLAGWEKALLSLQSLYAECERTTVNKVFQTTEVFKGSAKYLKAPASGQGSRASLEIYKVTAKGLSPTIFEKYVCTGTYLYEYAPANQVIRVHDLPKPKAGQIADDNFLSFLFGMKAAEAKQRYQLSLTPSDQYYHYIKIEPKLPQDKADFTVAQLVIRRDNSLPARVWFHQPNGNQTTWSFPQVRRDIPIAPAAFEQPALPRGWKFERVTGDAKAKVRGTGS